MREEAGREVSYLLLEREADRKTVVRKLHGGRSAQERVAEFLSSPSSHSNTLTRYGTCSCQG